MNEKRRISRALWSIVAVTFALAALGSLGWYYAANKLETQLAVLKDRAAERGRTITCAGEEVRGYPFRLGVFCDDLKVEDQNSDASLTIGPVRSAAQVYNPSKIISEVDGPAVVTLPGREIRANWEFLRSSLVVGLSGPKRMSAEGRNLKLEERAQSISADAFQAHSRQINENDVDLAFSADNLLIIDGNRHSPPPVNLRVDGQIKDVAKELLGGQRIIDILREKGSEGQLRQMNLALKDGGAIEVSGPFSLTNEGALSGKFKIKVNDFRKLVNVLKRANPDQGGQIEQFATLVSTLTGGTDNAEFAVNLVEGRVMLGLFPVGEIKPLF